MTLLKVFNEALKQIPSNAMELEEILARRDLPQEKKYQAVEIVRQLQGSELVGETPYHDRVDLKELKITLSPNECGIEDSDTFCNENMEIAQQYMNELVDSINYCSQDILFSYFGHCRNNDDKTCDFSINWYF